MPLDLNTHHLYFSHHRGRRIELSYSDSLKGPWIVYPKGVLDMKDTIAEHHIASPEVIIDEDNKKIVMFFHGKQMGRGPQFTLRSVSYNGFFLR